jgi:hypothetical protein
MLQIHHIDTSYAYTVYSHGGHRVTKYPVLIYIALRESFYFSFQRNYLSPIALFSPLNPTVRGLSVALTM